MTETPSVKTKVVGRGRPAKLGDWIGMAVIGIFFVVGIVVFATLFVPDFLRRGTQEDLIQGGGALASARIVWVSETGRWYAKKPILHFSVKVSPAGAAEFATQFDQEVGLLQLGQFHPGTQIQVRYNPAAPSDVAIVYEPVP